MRCTVLLFDPVTLVTNVAVQKAARDGAVTLVTSARRKPLPEMLYAIRIKKTSLYVTTGWLC